MFKHFLSLLPLLLLLSLQNPKVSAQSTAPSPAPAGPARIVSVLKKAGHFNTLIRLLKRTHMDYRIYSLLNNSNPLTMFAPSDEAFGKLKSKTLKSLNFQQSIQLIQFHVVNSLLSISDFQTVSNPLSTQAGDNSNYKFPLNVTMSGTNQVDIKTGIVNATVTGTVYSDDLLAVYQVDHVLLPMRFFVSPPPTPPPPPPPPSKPEEEEEEEDLSPSGSSEPSGAESAIHRGLNAISLVAFVICWLLAY